MSNKTEKAKRREQRAQERQVLDAFLANAIGALRKLCGQDLREMRDKFPGHPLPCKSCAFRSAYDSEQGYDKTVMGLLHVLVSGQPFYCHVDPKTNEPFPVINGEYGVLQAMQAGKKVSLCAAWSALAMRDKEEFIGLIADSIMGKPTERPTPKRLRDQILRITEGLD